MSKTLLGLSFPGTQEAKIAAQKFRNERTQKQKAGSGYSGGRRGYRSLMDSAQLSQQIGDYSQHYKGPGTATKPGVEGVYCLKVMTADGKDAVGGASINIGGRMFTAGDEGNLRIVDSEYVNEEIAAAKALRAYQNGIIEAVLVSDQMAQHILTKDTFELLKGTKGIDKLSPILKEVDATPDVIKYYDPTSVEFARALAKVRATVAHAGIIINTESGDLKGDGVSALRATTTGVDMPAASKPAPAG